MSAAVAIVSPFFFEVGNLSVFYARTYSAFTGRMFWGEVIKMMMRIGIESLPIVISVTAFVGLNIVVQGYQMMRLLGAQDMVGMFLAMAAVRELAPILAAALVGAKAGCGMASELGTMRIREQIDALEVMSVDPYRFLIAPRVIAAIAMGPLITIVALWSCIAAGYLAAVYQFDLNGSLFLSEVFRFITPRDLLNVLLKSGAFAAVCFPIVCYAGFYAEGGARGVGDATNRAIVWGAIGIVTINAVLTAIMY